MRISLDGRWVHIAPQPNWLGVCYATIQVYDSLMSASDTFQVSGVPIVGRVYTPHVRRQRPSE